MKKSVEGKSKIALEIYDRWANEIVAQHYDGDPRVLDANIKQMDVLE